MESARLNCVRYCYYASSSVEISAWPSGLSTDRTQHRLPNRPNCRYSVLSHPSRITPDSIHRSRLAPFPLPLHAYYLILYLIFSIRTNDRFFCFLSCGRTSFFQFPGKAWCLQFLNSTLPSNQNPSRICFEYSFAVLSPPIRIAPRKCYPQKIPITNP